MAKYEMLYLLNNELSDEAKEAEIAKYEDVVKTMGGAVVSTLPAVEVREFIGVSSRLESKPLKQRKRRFFGQNRNGEPTALLDHIVGEILLVDGDADTVGVVSHLNGGVDDAGVIAFAVIGGQHEQTVG